MNREKRGHACRGLSVRGLTVIAAAGSGLFGTTPRADQNGSFQTYVARGYREIADYAATRVGDPTLAAHFRRRAALAAAGQVAQPEALDHWQVQGGGGLPGRGDGRRKFYVAFSRLAPPVPAVAAAVPAPQPLPATKPPPPV